MKPNLISLPPPPPPLEDLLLPHAEADSAIAAPTATTPVTVMNLRRKVANLSSQIRHGSGRGSPRGGGLRGCERPVTTGSTCSTPANLRRSAGFPGPEPKGYAFVIGP